MYCNKCGNELPEGASFCTACGSQLNLTTNSTPVSGSYSQPQPSPSSAESTKKPKRKASFLKVLVVILLVVALLSGVTVLSYFTFLPAKYTLLTAGYSSILKNYNNFDNNMEQYDKLVKQVLDETITSDTNLAFSVDKEVLEKLNAPPESIEMIEKSLKNVKIFITSALDTKNKKQTASLELNYLNNPLATANVYIDNTKFGFGIPELFEQTITGDLKELGNLYQLIPDIDPSVLEQMQMTDPWSSYRILEDVKIDRKDIKKLMLDYSKEIINSIDDSDMSITRGKSTKVLGKSTSCQEVTIKLDQKAQKKIVENILKKLKNDNNAYNLTIGNIKKILNILGENEQFKQILNSANIEEILSKDKYKEALNTIIDNLDESSFPEKIVVKAYIKGLDIVKYTIDFTTSDIGMLLSIERKTEEISFENQITLSANSNGEKIDFMLALKKDYDKSSDTSDYLVDLSADVDTSDNKTKMSFKFDSNENAKGKNAVDHKISSSLLVDSATSYEPIKVEMSFNLDGTKTRNSKGMITAAEYKGDIGLSAPSKMPETLKLGFTADTEIEYGKKVEIPQPNKALDLSTATQEDFENIQYEIMEKLGALSSLMGSF